MTESDAYESFITDMAQQLASWRDGPDKELAHEFARRLVGQMRTRQDAWWKAKK